MNDDSRTPPSGSSANPSAKSPPPNNDTTHVRTPPDKHDSTVVWPRETAGKSPSTAAGHEPPTLESIGKYRIIGVLDSGGQGDVYRALHPQLQKELLIKVGRRAVSDGQDAQDRLISEGRVLAELDHPNLARVYDLDFFERRPYLVMEYIRGRNLRQHAANDALTWREAARLVAQTARALMAAHTRGVLHLDVKPENIIVDEKGAARLIDFGLARLRHAWSDDAPAPGSVSGTIPYMAPEQARGETDALDQRTDIFALGAVLYWLLTGKPPFGPGAKPSPLVAARNCEFDREALERSTAPRSLVEACFRAMSAEQANRFPSADALAEVLERIVAPAEKSRSLASVNVGNLGCAVTITACMLFVAVGLYLWNLPESMRDTVAVGTPTEETPSGEETNSRLQKPGAGQDDEPKPPAHPEAVPPVPGPVESQVYPPTPTRAAKITPKIQAFVERAGEMLELDAKAAPITLTKDRLRFVADLPPDVRPVLCVFDRPGELRWLKMDFDGQSDGSVRWKWEGIVAAEDTPEQTPRTITVLLCANPVATSPPSAEPDPAALATLREAMDVAKPWPVHSGNWEMWFERSGGDFAFSPAGDGLSAEELTFRESIKDRAAAASQALSKQYKYVAGIAFPAQ